MENERNYEVDKEHVVSIGDWIVTLILVSIPVFGFILELIWAFGSNVPRSKSNWAKALIIFQLAGILITILFWGTILGIVSGLEFF